MRRKGGLGWIPGIVPRHVTAEDQFWRSLDLSGKVVYDIGAFEGLLTLFFASRAKQVVSFEPNERNRKRLEENLKLNEMSNVLVRAVAMGAIAEKRRMINDPLMPGGATLDAEISRNIVRNRLRHVEQWIAVTTLDEEAETANLLPPDLIKIDIEGWEIEALRGARQTLLTHRPALFLELHGETIAEKTRKTTEIVGFLWELSYRNLRHIETAKQISVSDAVLPIEGHLYCV
jgi:FkbM family methyltransferase